MKTIKLNLKEVIMNIKTLKKEIKGVFKLPKKVYYFGKIIHGTPYFNPINFSNSIIKIRRLELNTKEYLDTLPNDYIRKAKKFKNLPMVRRSKQWIIKLFGQHYWIQIGYPFKIHKNQLGWKDKYESPRFEWSPAFQIFFFNWQFCIHWVAPDDDNDRYYEMVLWYLEYSNKDIIEAEKTWGWTDYDTKESTWDKKYLI